MTLRVTVTDLETGDSDEAEVREGDYILICHEPCRLVRTQTYREGTAHVLTVNGRTPAPEEDTE